MLFQVCESLAEPQTRKREVAALTEAMEERNIQTGAVVTRNDSERFDIECGSSKVVMA